MVQPGQTERVETEGHCAVVDRVGIFAGEIRRLQTNAVLGVGKRKFWGIGGGLHTMTSVVDIEGAVGNEKGMSTRD